MNVEEDFLDVLQNIEAAVSAAAEADASLTDYDVEKVYNTLIVRYAAEVANKPAVDLTGDGPAQRLFAVVKDICEWRMGRLTLPAHPAVEPIDLNVVIGCLKRLRKSVQRWTKEGGRKGYLTFIAEFL